MVLEWLDTAAYDECVKGVVDDRQGDIIGNGNGEGCVMVSSYPIASVDIKCLMELSS